MVFNAIKNKLIGKSKGQKQFEDRCDEIGQAIQDIFKEKKVNVYEFGEILHRFNLNYIRSVNGTLNEKNTQLNLLRAQVEGNSNLPDMPERKEI